MKLFFSHINFISLEMEFKSSRGKSLKRFRGLYSQNITGERRLEEFKVGRGSKTNLKQKSKIKASDIFFLMAINFDAYSDDFAHFFVFCLLTFGYIKKNKTKFFPLYSFEICFPINNVLLLVDMLFGSLLRNSFHLFFCSFSNSQDSTQNFWRCLTSKFT